ncbi:MAG: carbon starvation CstA family protein [Enterobacter hormaechei]
MCPNSYVLFGHHFAAIAGAGPLVGRCWLRRWACRVRLAAGGRGARGRGAGLYGAVYLLTP